MNKLIPAIILVLLLSPSMALAEEQQPPSFSDEERKDLDNVNAFYNIGYDMFQDVYREYGHNYRLSSFFRALGYENLAKEVLKDVPNLHGDFGLDLFYKHEDKYKYHSGTAEMFFPSVQILNSMVDGYQLGYTEATERYKGKDLSSIADIVPKMYEEYLEIKKGKQLKQKDNQTDRKGER